VHINPRVPLDYIVIEAEFDGTLTEDLSKVSFSTGWDAEPPGPASMAVGDKWLKEGRSAVLSVPSCLTSEPNFLLNPEHKDFKHVKIGKPKAFRFDPRLV
jgi:RES domain-containing protein